MFKKLILCDYFLEIACHCLNINTNVRQFKRLSYEFDKKNGSNVFIMINASEHITEQNPFHKTYVSCCKDFVDFQF